MFFIMPFLLIKGIIINNGYISNCLIIIIISRIKKIKSIITSTLFYDQNIYQQSEKDKERDLI